MAEKNCCELRYFQVVLSWSSDPETLFLEKCKMIYNASVRYPEGLKIYFNGDEWLFDYLPTKKQASQVIAESCFTKYDVAKSLKGMVKNVV